MKVMILFGRWFVAGLILVGALSMCHQAHAACGGFDLMLDVYADGHHSIVINPNFASFQACKTAGMDAQSRWAHLGEKVDFICVSHK